MKVIKGSELPMIGWCGEEPLDPAKFEPPTLSRIDLLSEATKPHPGGLWCSPALIRIFTRRPIATSWTHRNRGEGIETFTVVKPHPTATVAVIDSRKDLVEIIERWPDDRKSPYASRSGYRDLVVGLDGHVRSRDELPPTRVDWPAMAKEVDAVYLTHDGYEECGNVFEYPHLWGWDTPTVLFLQPAYRAGKVYRNREVPEPNKVLLAALFALLRFFIWRAKTTTKIKVWWDTRVRRKK